MSLSHGVFLEYNKCLCNWCTASSECLSKHAQSCAPSLCRTQGGKGLVALSTKNVLQQKVSELALLDLQSLNYLRVIELLADFENKKYPGVVCATYVDRYSAFGLGSRDHHPLLVVRAYTNSSLSWLFSASFACVL